MSRALTVVLHSIEEDGYPDMDDRDLVGRIAFVWDGCIVSGWPLHVNPDDHSTPFSGQWEPSEDRFGGPVSGVTHWLLLPRPAWRLQEHNTAEEAP